MSSVSSTSDHQTAAVKPQRKRRKTSFDRPRFLWGVVVGVLVFLFTPIAVVIVYSFNALDSLARFEGWSLQWYQVALTDTGIRDSFLQSMLIALTSTGVSVVLGTAMALGIRRSSQWLRATSNSSVVIRLASPETATAVALLLTFGLLGIPLSFNTVLMAHVALSLAFVVVIVQSRLSSLGDEIENAAMDLGSHQGGAAWRVVLPLLAPSIVVAGMLAFIISFDNFATSFFTVGIGTSPLPLWIYSSMRFGVSPVVNALGVMMLVFTLALAAIAVVALRKSQKKR